MVRERDDIASIGGGWRRSSYPLFNGSGIFPGALHQARAHRENGIRQFEAEFGRTDRIDASLLRDLQNLQLRFAAISARQTQFGSAGEPKVSRFTRLLGEMIKGY